MSTGIITLSDDALSSLMGEITGFGWDGRICTGNGGGVVDEGESRAQSLDEREERESRWMTI